MCEIAPLIRGPVACNASKEYFELVFEILNRAQSSFVRPRTTLVGYFVIPMCSYCTLLTHTVTRCNHLTCVGKASNRPP
jgi:hypothetical protein